MDARRAVSSWSFVVVVVCLIVIIGARCGRVVGETALNYSRPTVATYSMPDSYEKLAHSSGGDFSKEEEEEEEVVVGEGAPADFVPTKLYAQVRRTHTVERLPRGDALKSATNEEEILAAPRLREVVSKSKTNTVYTEEGYEDAAYDHGGHVRDAEFREDYEKKLGEEAEPINPTQQLENVWRDASINPKDVAENEIERLEEDLKSEYEESERNAENKSLTEKPKTAGSEEDEDEIDESTAAAMSLTDIESVPTSAEPSAEYGKIFWDYFKSIGRKKNEARNSSLDDGSTVVGPSSVNFHSPATEFDDSYAADGRKDAYPSAASLYESWKRQDRYGNSEESREFESFGSDRPQSEEELSEDHTLVNLQNFEGSTTLVGPKKLSYTIIVRPSEKAGTSTATTTTTRSCPCDRRVDGTRHGERTPVVKWFPREEASREAVNDFSNANDFTGVRAMPPPPPPSLPALRQITYADFPPDSYASLTQPSVSREIGRSAGERDPYEPSKNSYANSGQNPRGNRFRSCRKKPRLVFHPRTRLVPPLLANGSKYSQIVGAKATGKGINKKFDGISGRKSWPEIQRFYRSFEKRLFGRRKRSLAVEGKSKEAAARVSGEKKMPPKRNLFGESDRSVEPDNGRAEKPKVYNERRKSSHGDEKLLREAPRIVEQVINGEIQARFNNQEHEPSDDEYDDDDEKGERIEAQVAEFNASEVLEEDESSEGDRVMIKTTAKDAFVDSEKYPFYENSKVGLSSPLNYATNPRKIPHKTPGGTEFYDSRDAYRECEEVRPELVVPEEDGGEDSSVEREPRLRGLGDSLDCFRGKYLDDDPLDNPLFLESQVGQPRIPEELDPKKLHLRISEDPSSEEDARVVRRISKRPEDKERSSEPAAYRRHVYEDVTGTIKNLAALYERFGEAVIPSSRFHRYRLVPYGTKRASYGRRRRKEEEKPPGSVEGVEGGYFGIVSVHKRSVNNEGQSLLESNATRKNETRIVYTIRDRTRGSKPPPRNLTRGRRVTVERKKDSSDSENKEPATVRMVDSSRAKKKTTSDAKDRYLGEPNEETYRIRGERLESENLRDRAGAEKSEETLSNSGSVESTEQEPRLLEPREYLQSEPPGYTEASVNESSEAAASSSEKPDGDEDLRGSERYKNFEESGEEEEEESRERPHRVAEDSKMEWEGFASRPFSPFESFEDPKYGELGPRLSKPSFHHPSFASVIASRRIEYSGESGSDESDEAKSRYSFPWDRSHEDQEWREYPWERRERLARERRGRAKERKRHQRLYGFNDDEHDEDASETRSNERFVYPWERYGLPSRIYGRKARITDNEETSSIARPRFSSRYKTKIGRVNGDEKDDDPARTFRVDNGKMKISVTESLEEANATTSLAPKKPIRRKIATPLATDSGISRTSTTKKPLVGKRKNSRVAKELSREAPKVSRKTRGRATSTTTTTTTTGRSPLRPRFRKKNPVESATIGSSVIEKSTTTPPMVKTVESHTRFSKERITTNSSYPVWNDSLYAREKDRIGGERPDAGRRKPRIPSETVRRESTMSEETPDRVYRGKIIKENGATNTSVTVATSKNGTNSLVDTLEASKMLESFEDSEETPVDEDSFARDSHLLANLLSRLPPYTNNLTTLREDARGSEAFSEGSGSLPDDYEKHPERRLYFYVQDL